MGIYAPHQLFCLNSFAPSYLNTLYQTINGNWFYRYTLTHSSLGQVKQQNGQGAVTV